MPGLSPPPRPYSPYSAKRGPARHRERRRLLPGPSAHAEAGSEAARALLPAAAPWMRNLPGSSPAALTVACRQAPHWPAAQGIARISGDVSGAAVAPPADPEAVAASSGPRRRASGGFPGTDGWRRAGGREQRQQRNEWGDIREVTFAFI